MLNKLTSYALSLWHPDPKYKGLQVMVLGFFGAMVGASIALVGGALGHGESAVLFLQFSEVMAYFGAVLMVLGALIMFSGIVLHWMYMFRGDVEK